MARRLPVLVGATSLLLTAVVLALPTGGPPPAGTPTLPARLPGYSYLTADVSADPAGRALALFQFGFGEFIDVPQAVVMGADAPTARRVDAAEQRGGDVTTADTVSRREGHGDPDPMLLSPDGTTVAVGDHATFLPHVELVDLTSGTATTLPLPGGRSVLPLAWSPDGTRIAYVTTPQPYHPYYDGPGGGDLGLLDVTTGLASPVPGATGVSGVAFSPDGSRLAVQRDDLTIVEPDGTLVRRVEVPPAHRLNGAAAWSPDGALLATSPDPYRCDGVVDPDAFVACLSQYPEVTAFVDATGSGAAVPDPVPTAQTMLGYTDVVAWTGPDTVVVLAAVGDPLQLTEVPLHGGEPRLLGEIPTAGRLFGVVSFRLATALLPDLQVGGVAPADHGPWPVPLRLGAAAVLGLIAAAVTAIVQRRRAAGTGDARSAGDVDGDGGARVALATRS